MLKIPPDEIAITIVSAEELIRGRLAQVRKSKTSKERVSAYYWLMKTFEFLKGFVVLAYDARAEAQFQILLTQKIRVGTQDLKISAIALSQKAILFTRNRRDFNRIEGLEFEDWSIL